MENRLKVMLKTKIITKILLSFLIIFIGVLFQIVMSKGDSANYLKILYYFLTISGVLQLILSISTLLINKYNKFFMICDLIEGLSYSIISTVLIITFFKWLVLVAKLFFGTIIILKVVLRIRFWIRCIKDLNNKSISNDALNKLGNRILSYTLIKTLIASIISLISIYYFFSMVTQTVL